MNVPGGLPPNYRGYHPATAQAQAQVQAQAQAQAAAAAAAGHYRGGPVPVAPPAVGSMPGAAPGGRRGGAVPYMQASAHGVAPGMPAAPMPTMPGGVPVPGSVPPPGAAGPAGAAAAFPGQLPPHMMTSHRTTLTQQEVAARRSRKPTSKAIPAGVGNAIVGDGVEQYKKLRELERRLDSVMVRKRLDLGEGVGINARRGGREGRLRLWISNEVKEQGVGENAAKKITVKVEGRVLDVEGRPWEPDHESDDEDEDGEGERDNDAMDEDKTTQESKAEKEKEAAERPRLSHFFKSMTVEFEQPQNHSIPVSADTTALQWSKPTIPPNTSSSTLPPSASFDSLTFTRSTNVNLNATLILERDDFPEPEGQRYKLSPELSAILDREEDTRSGIIVGLYEYIRALNLQESEERRSVRCDEALSRLFNGREKIYFAMIPEVVAMHTTVIPPLRLPFAIRVDEEYLSDPQPTIYDIQIPLPDPIQAKLTKILSDPSYPATLRQVAGLDNQLGFIIQALQHSSAKHNFLTSFAADPVAFVRSWVSSQKRDLQVILGEGENGEGVVLPPVEGEEVQLGSEFRRGGKNGAWDTPVAKEAVRYMLAKPAKAR